MAPRLRVCNVTGCPELTPTPRCPTHTRLAQAAQARQRRARGDESMDIYSTTAWRRIRARYLARHPNCHDCTEPAAHVDHVAPRKILMAAGIHDPDRSTWLQALCHRCHSHKTAAVDAPLLARLRAGESAEALAAVALNPTTR